MMLHDQRGAGAAAPEAQAWVFARSTPRVLGGDEAKPPEAQVQNARRRCRIQDVAEFQYGRG